MIIKLFLDDTRTPYDKDWVLARNSKEALSFMRSSNQIEEISLDWHLGLYQPSGDEVLKKLLEHPLSRTVFRNTRRALVHTSSGMGRSLLHGGLRDARRHGILPRSCLITDNPMAFRHPDELYKR